MKKKFFITAAVLVISIVAGITLKAEAGGGDNETQQGTLLPEVVISCAANCSTFDGRCWTKDCETGQCKIDGSQNVNCRC